jgi:hypothetical protein
MRQPICVKCRVSMACVKTGVDVEAMAGDMPYQIWSGDLFECPSCKVEIVSGFGQQPVAEHFQEERFAKFVPGVLLRFWGNLKDKEA